MLSIVPPFPPFAEKLPVPFNELVITQIDPPEPPPAEYLCPPQFWDPP